MSNKKGRFLRKIASVVTALMLLLQTIVPYGILSSRVVAPVGADEETTVEKTTSENSSSPTETPDNETTNEQPAEDVTNTDAPTATPEKTITPTNTAEPTSSTQQTPVTQKVPEDENVPTQSSEESPTSTPADQKNAIEASVFESPQCFQNSLNGCSPTLNTDKDDYYPTEVVWITAHGLSANTSYELVIFSDDDPAVYKRFDVITDEAGGFTASYQLDGIYRPNYVVEVYDKNKSLVISTSFTDDSGVCPGGDNSWNDDDWYKDESSSGGFAINAPGYTIDQVCVKGGSNASPNGYKITVNADGTYKKDGKLGDEGCIIIAGIGSSSASASHTGIDEDECAAISHASFHRIPESTITPTITPTPTPTIGNGPYCGDGTVNQQTEQCDDRNNNNDDYCTNDCTFNRVCLPEVNMVVNPDFELPIVTASQKWDIFPDGTPLLGWNVQWRQSFAPFGGSTLPEIANLELHQGVNGWTPQSDSQYAELDTDWNGHVGSLNNEPASVRIMQNLPTISGYEYKISYWFAPRPGTPLSDNQLDFSWNGVSQNTASAAGAGSTNWQMLEHTIVADSDTSMISFTDKGTANSLGTFIDNVSVECIPPKTGDIGGIKFNDLNGNGTRDKNDPVVTHTDVLGGIRIFIDENDNGIFDEGEKTAQTKDDGSYEFNDLLPGSYDVCEEIPDGWIATTPQCGTVTVKSGETSTQNYGNFKLGMIQGRKFHDLNVDGTRNGGEPFLDGWTIRLYQNIEDEWTLINSMNTGDDTTEAGSVIDGQYRFVDLERGSYRVCEVLEDNWMQTRPSGVQNNIQSNEAPRCYNLNINASGQRRTGRTFGNAELGTITVTKIRDNNGNGEYEPEDGEVTLGSWEILLDKDGQEYAKQNTDENGETVFNSLTPGSYSIGETEQLGYSLVTIECDDRRSERSDRFESAVAIDSESNNGFVNSIVNRYSLTLRSGDDISCFVYNQPIDPQILIEKFNNAAGVLSAGGQVVYTLRLTVSEEGGPSLNTVVTDLHPEGINYVSGSWSATKNASSFAISEPTYASPGDWSLGDLNPGDVVEMTYLANISSDQDNGIYPDLAWAEGESVGGAQILAQAGTLGNIGDERFVGTEVQIDSRVETRKAFDAEKEVEEEGEVLGAVSEILPATGAQTIWMILASLLTGFGAISLATAYAIRRKKLSIPALKKISKMFVLALLITGAFHIAPSAVLAEDADLSIRVENASDTFLREFNIGYVALDLQNRPVSVACYQKGPGDAGYSQFDTTKSTYNGNCKVDSSVINTDGTYLFYAVVTAGSDSKTSNTISVDINTEGPGTPTNYSKNKIGSCKYRLSFKTANDSGKTSYIEIYRSDSTSFAADAATRIHTQSAGSGEHIIFENEVPDCSKTWYYAVRAFNSLDAGSGIIGDAITVTTTSTTTSGTLETGGVQLGAIPVEAANIGAGGITTETVAVEDEETEGEEAQEGEETEGVVSGESEEEVLGARTDGGIQGFMDTLRNNIALSALIGLVLLGIIGYGIKRSRS